MLEQNCIINAQCHAYHKPRLRFKVKVATLIGFAHVQTKPKSNSNYIISLSLSYIDIYRRAIHHPIVHVTTSPPNASPQHNLSLGLGLG
jgi:hypothetical protein